MITRRIEIDRSDAGKNPLIASVNDSATGHMPILVATVGEDVWMTWSDWAEIRDHIEGCAPARAWGGLDYEPCAQPQPSPGDPANCCILAVDHLMGGEVGHCDRFGNRW